MFNTTVAGLAILKVNADNGQDFIDGFVPFVCEALRRAPTDIVSLPELQSTIRETFGLNLPQGALSTVLNRAIRRGFARRDSGAITRDTDALGPSSIAGVRDQFLAKYDALVANVQEFARTEFKREMSAESASEALAGFLSAHAADVLRATSGGVPLSPDYFADGSRADYLIAKFILNASRSDQTSFELLETAVRGAMLAATLLYPEPSSAVRRFDGLQVYLDTRFVLQLLGWEGDVLGLPRTELISLLRATGARCFVFEHTVDEIRGVLTAALYTLRNKSALKHAIGPTIQFMIESGTKPSDVELALSRLDAKLVGLGIAVKPTPEYRTHLTIGESDLAAAYDAVVKQRSKQARDNDVSSASAVYRLRGGTIPIVPERAKAVFVTTNDTLVRATRDFFVGSGYGYQADSVPIMLTADVATTLAWLKKPDLAPSLPRERLIADCYAAMNPSPELWAQYVRELDKLEADNDISEDDFIGLRFGSSAKNTLMDVTLGSPAALSEGTVAQIMQRMKDSMTLELREDFARVVVELTAEQKMRAEAESAAAIARGEREAAIGQAQDRVSRMARRIAHGVVSLIVVLLLVAAAASAERGIATRLLPNLLVSALASAGTIVVLTAGIAQLLDWIFDLSAKDIYLRCVTRVARFVEEHI